MSKKQKTGFTIIELLIVISIIALLSTLFIPSFNQARRQARDSGRKVNMNALHRALSFYYGNEIGYPEPASGWGTGECIDGSYGIGQILEVDSRIITKVPKDFLWPNTEPSTFNGGSIKDYAISPSEDFCFWYFSDDPNHYYISYFIEEDSKAGSSGIHVMTEVGLIQ